MIRFIVLAVILLTTAIQAQDWQLLEFPLADNITGVNFLTDDTGFVVTQSGYVGRTIDGGKEWKINNSLKGENLDDIFVQDINTIYICGKNGHVFKTTSGGADWNNISINDTAGWLFDIEMLDENNGLVIGMKEIDKNPMVGIAFRTADGGTTWDKIDIIGMGFSEIFYQKGIQLSFLSFGKLYHSSDKGKSWQFYHVPGSNPGRALSFAGNNGIICGLKGKRLYTIDGGKTWNESGGNSHEILVAAQMINGTTGYIGGLDGKAYITTNGGKEWNQELLPVTFNILDFHLAQKRLYAVGSDGRIIYKVVR